MMKKNWCLLLIILVATDVIRQHKAQKAKDLVHTLVNAYLELEYSPPGASVAVLRDGEIIYAEGFGYSNITTKEKVIVNTQFRAASVSKMMTATSCTNHASLKFTRMLVASSAKNEI